MKNGTRISVFLAIIIPSAAMVLYGMHLVNSIPPLRGDISAAMRVGIEQMLFGLALMGCGSIVAVVALEYALAVRRDSRGFRGVGR